MPRPQGRFGKKKDGKKRERGNNLFKRKKFCRFTAEGVKEIDYTKGDQVLIEVRLDEPQEDVHIHGYDIEELNPSGTVRFDFPAKLDGIFELEAHGPSGDVVLAEIVVNPS